MIDPLSTTAPDTPWATLTDAFSPKYRFAELDERAVMASMDPIPRYFFRRTPSWKKYCPGASSVPASIEPIIATLAPSDNALTMCPEAEIPPSAQIGTPYLKT